MGSGSEPNAENKLFVGGCPPGCGDEELRQVFEKYGQVEEVFVMRGGSRSGMACAFIRFQAQAQAQAAIDAIHGQITLPKSAEPLVVRWADAPGSRRRDARERKGGRSGPGGRENSLPAQGYPFMGQHGFNYQQMQAMQMQMPMHNPASYNGVYYPQQQMASMQQHWQNQQMAMMGYPQMPPNPAAMMMGSGQMLHAPPHMGDPRMHQFGHAGSADGLSIGVPVAEMGDTSQAAGSPAGSPHLGPSWGYQYVPVMQLPAEHWQEQ